MRVFFNIRKYDHLDPMLAPLIAPTQWQKMLNTKIGKMENRAIDVRREICGAEKFGENVKPVGKLSSAFSSLGTKSTKIRNIGVAKTKC